MTTKKIVLCLSLLFLIVAFSSVCAASPVSIDNNSITVNGMPYDPLVGKAVLYTDAMNFGLATIYGKAVSSEGNIAKVEVSLDNGISWKRAELNRSGSFNFRFRLDGKSKYTALLRATDRLDNQNDARQNLVRIEVSDISLRSLIEGRLAEMITAYQNKNPFNFMRYVSPDFRDREALELALRRDFSALSRIDINTSIINMTGDGKGNIAVAFQYQRNVLSSHSGQNISDTGLTEITFKLSDQGPLLWKMRIPLMFGLSGNDELHSGVVRASDNTQVLTINPINGSVQKKDINSIASGSDTSNAEVRTSTLPSNNWLNLADGTVSPSSGNIQALTNPHYAEYIAGPNIYFYEMANFTSTVPLYSSGLYSSTMWSGNGFLAVYNSSTGKYAVVERLAFSGSSTTFKVRYQPNGSTSF